MCECGNNKFIDRYGHIIYTDCFNISSFNTAWSTEPYECTECGQVYDSFDEMERDR